MADALARREVNIRLDVSCNQLLSLIRIRVIPDYIRLALPASWTLPWWYRARLRLYCRLTAFVAIYPLDPTHFHL
jgi:hypothetical protein